MLHIAFCLQPEPVNEYCTIPLQHSCLMQCQWRRVVMSSYVKPGSWIADGDISCSNSTSRMPTGALHQDSHFMRGKRHKVLYPHENSPRKTFQAVGSCHDDQSPQACLVLQLHLQVSRHLLQQVHHILLGKGLAGAGGVLLIIAKYMALLFCRQMPQECESSCLVDAILLAD